MMMMMMMMMIIKMIISFLHQNPCYIIDRHCKVKVANRKNQIFLTFLSDRHLAFYHSWFYDYCLHLYFYIHNMLMMCPPDLLRCFLSHWSF